MLARMTILNFIILTLGMTGINDSISAEEQSKAASTTEAATPSSAAVPAVDSWDSFGNDVELEIRVILAGTSGLSGSVPRDLNDMRAILTERFSNYRSFKSINTIWLSSWTGEKAVSMVFPEHILTAEIAAVDPKGERAKVTVSLGRDRGETREKEQNYIRAGDVAVGQTQKNTPPGEPLELLRSSMTVGPSTWQVIGGIQVHVSPDGKEIASEARDRNILSTTIVGTTRDDSAQTRYLIIGLRTRERMSTQTTNSNSQ